MVSFFLMGCSYNLNDDAKRLSLWYPFLERPYTWNWKRYLPLFSYFLGRWCQRLAINELENSITLHAVLYLEKQKQI